MNYTTSLTITARTAWATWYEASAIACTVTATAWDWYAGAFFSPAAQRRYEWTGQMIACLGLLAYLYGKRLRGVVQGWVDAEVDGALPAIEAASADHIADAREVVETDPFCPTVNPLPVVDATAKPPTIRELKAQAKAAKVPNYGRMTKTQLVEALRTA